MAKTLFWITNDLRIEDNPALNHALESEAILPVYVHDVEQAWPIQGASAWYLHHALAKLESAYRKLGLQLHLSSGIAFEKITGLVKKYEIEEVVCARAYTLHEREQQKKLKTWCDAHGVGFLRFPSTLLAEPESVVNKQGSYYKVYTPFSKYYFQHTLRQPQTLTAQHNALPIIADGSSTLDELGLISSINWAVDFPKYWQAGEHSAHKNLCNAIDTKISGYAEQRDFMAIDGTSKLSANLRFGEISPAQAWQEISQTMSTEIAFPFLRQLVWREFQYHLMFHRPEITDSCFSVKFNHFQWEPSSDLLSSWQQAQTGYPIVDAAMTQLWQSGWMHNRARMIVASFLTKHLLISWEDGARWFWDTLVDADLPNNTNGWQWTAGCGADAAPYFRIFNPITQGEKFDKNGDYTCHWLPQLKDLNKKYLFQPWKAPKSELDRAGIRLGDNYPLPIVDHSSAREKALSAYQALKGKD